MMGLPSIGDDNVVEHEARERGRQTRHHAGDQRAIS